MSQSKADLVELGLRFGIKNAGDYPYAQLDKLIHEKRADGYSPRTIEIRTPVEHVRRVELRKGIVRWYYVVKGGKTEIMFVSQKYFSRVNAERAAIAVAKENDYGFNNV